MALGKDDGRYLYGEAETVSSAAQTVEIPFIDRNRANSLLVLSEEKGETIRTGKEDVCAPYGMTLLGKRRQSMHNGFGQHPCMVAAPDCLLGRTAIWLTMQYLRYLRHNLLHKGADSWGNVVSETDRKRDIPISIIEMFFFKDDLGPG